MVDRATDESLLAAVPAFFAISDLLKATPAAEGGKRYVYLEASNEALDAQNEVVLAKALADSADYYLRYGNIDIDHVTQIGQKRGIQDANLYEIGQPVDVAVRDGRTFVKGLIYAGAGPAAARANDFWSSLTEVQPPHRWYPSVGGSILDRGVVIDPKSKLRKAVVRKVRWSNVGFSKTPVNQSVPTVSTIPVGALSKAWTADGIDIAKALEAGYGTDSASLTGGGALRRQSLDGAPINYQDFRDRLTAALRSGGVGRNPGARDLMTFAAAEYGLSANEAGEWVERWMHEAAAVIRKHRGEQARQSTGA